jgi:hypothetical protein
MNITMPVKKVSKWEFDTSATGGGGIGLFAASGGMIQLKAEDMSLRAQFHYGGAGIGGSLGGKIPKIGKLPKIDLKDRSGTGSTTDFNSYGDVLVMAGCNKDELAATDFSGPCMYVDGGAGLIVGYGGTAILTGLSVLKILALGGIETNPMAMIDLIYSAKGLIFMNGWNAGVQAGGGISINLGYLYMNYVRGLDGINIPPDDVQKTTPQQ